MFENRASMWSGFGFALLAPWLRPAGLPGLLLTRGQAVLTAVWPFRTFAGHCIRRTFVTSIGGLRVPVLVPHGLQPCCCQWALLMLPLGLGVVFCGGLPLGLRLRRLLNRTSTLNLTEAAPHGSSRKVRNVCAEVA